MQYGLQISTSGILTGMYRTNVLANNLANINTTGFKPDSAFTRQRAVVREEDGVYSLPSNRLLEKLGAGSHMAPNRVDFGQGRLEHTGNPLDVAIEGEGFFVLRDAADEAGDSIRLTRDGRFTQASDGRLVSIASGLPVQDGQNNDIVLRDDATVEIDDEGVIYQDGRRIARLGLADVPDRGALKRVGENLFQPPAAAQNNVIEGEGRLRQGFIEQSAVTAISGLLAYQGAARSVSGNTRIAGYHDQIADQAINTFGRLS